MLQEKLDYISILQLKMILQYYFQTKRQPEYAPKTAGKNYNKNMADRDFPGGTVVKNPPAKAGDTGLSPGPGRSHRPHSN